MATIEKRPGRNKTQYRVKIRMRGHAPASATFDRLTDAKRWVAQTETAIRAGRWFQHIEAKRNTLSDLIERYRAEYLPHAGVRTHDRTEYLKYWAVELGNLTLAEMTPAEQAVEHDDAARLQIKGVQCQPLPIGAAPLPEHWCSRIWCIGR